MPASSPPKFPGFGQTAAPFNLKKCLENAAALAEQGNPAAATKLYAEILQVTPNQPDALFALGMIAFEQEKYAICVELLSNALNAKLTRSIPQALLHLAIALQLVGRHDEAVNLLSPLLPHFRRLGDRLPRTAEVLPSVPMPGPGRAQPAQADTGRRA